MRKILLMGLSIFFLISCGCSNNNHVDPGGPDGPIDPDNPPSPEEDDNLTRDEAKAFIESYPKEEALPNKITCTWDYSKSTGEVGIESAKEGVTAYGADVNLGVRGSREVPNEEINDVIDTIKTDDENIFNLNTDTFDSIFAQAGDIVWTFAKDDSNRLIAQEGDDNEGHSLIYNHQGYLVAYYCATSYELPLDLGLLSYMVSEVFGY